VYSRKKICLIIVIVIIIIIIIIIIQVFSLSNARIVGTNRIRRVDVCRFSVLIHVVCLGGGLALEANLEKIKYMFMSCHQNVGENRNILVKITNR
jgi:hypothetical protein